MERALAEHRSAYERQRQEAAALLERLGGRGHAGPVEIVRQAAFALAKGQADWSDEPMPAAADLIAAGRHLADARRSIDTIELDLIEALLDSGMTWEQLAVDLGRSSRQAMQQRYRRLGGTRTWPTRSPASAP